MRRVNGNGRRNVASASAKIALLAPIPSASVSAATAVKPGNASHLPKRRRDIGTQLLDELSQAHLSISLSAKVHAGPLEPADVTKPREHHLARNPRIHSSIDELSSTHLDMEGDLLIHFLGDVDTPKP